MVVVEVVLVRGAAPGRRRRRLVIKHAERGGRLLHAGHVADERRLLHGARAAERRVPPRPAPAHAPVPAVGAGVPLGEDATEEDAGGDVAEAGGLVARGLVICGGGGRGQVRGGRGGRRVRDETVLVKQERVWFMIEV